MWTSTLMLHLKGIEAGKIEFKKLAKIETCPRCGSGLRRINGPYGPFFGCTSWPGCEYRRRIKE